jgi:hypothetical protein
MSNLDPILRTLSALTSEQKRELVQRLSAENLAEVSAAAAETAKKTRLARIAAARGEGNPAFQLVQGALARAGIAIEEATSVAALDKLFANATRPVSVEDRMTIKAGLHRLGLLGA